MAKKKLSSTEKRAKEKKRLCDTILRALHFKAVCGKYGTKDVIWAMQRCVNNHRDLEKLKSQAKELKDELQQLEAKIR